MGGGGDYYKPKYVFKIGGRAYEPTPRNANARAGLVLAGLGGLLFWMVNTSLSCEVRARSGGRGAPDRHLRSLGWGCGAAEGTADGAAHLVLLPGGSPVRGHARL